MQNLPFVGFTYKKNIENQMQESIQSLFKEIDSAREKKKLNRHNSETKQSILKPNGASTPAVSQKRQKTQEFTGDKLEEVPISSILNAKKKQPVTAASFLKTRGLATKDSKPTLGMKTGDTAKKTPLASSTKLKKPLESPGTKKIGDKDSNPAMKPQTSSSKRQPSPKSKLTPGIGISTKISKNFAQPFISKEKNTSPTQAMGSVSSSSNVKKIISQIKTTTSQKSKVATAKDTATGTKPKVVDAKGDLSSKLMFKNS